MTVQGSNSVHVSGEAVRGQLVGGEGSSFEFEEDFLDCCCIWCGWICGGVYQQSAKIGVVQIRDSRSFGGFWGVLGSIRQYSEDMVHSAAVSPDLSSFAALTQKTGMLNQCALYFSINSYAARQHCWSKRVKLTAMAAVIKSTLPSLTQAPSLSPQLPQPRTVPPSLSQHLPLQRAQC